MAKSLTDILAFFNPAPVRETRRNGNDRSHPRPRIGKTAKDKANGHIPYKKNQRVWDSTARMWVKV